MRYLWLFVILACALSTATAQSVRDEIKGNIRCSASNYMAYPGPSARKLTPPPTGWKPFYISHYGRHGSRYHNRADTYDIPYQILASADSAGKLTPTGRDAMQRLARIREDACERWGELTDLGARQHRQIVQRMVQRFPDVFAGEVDIDARSTTVMRCILSMENAMVQAAAMCPKAKIHHNVTQRDMYYLNHQDRKIFSMKMDSATMACYMAFAQQYEKNDRLMALLFNDMAYVRQKVDAGKLNHFLFMVASSIQNTDMCKELTLYDLFTDDEIYRNWKKENARWYITFGGSPVNGGLQPYTQRVLLRKMIADADSCLRLKRPVVQMRFGHETVIMPLVCLLDINGYGMATSDLEALDRKGWANYRIFPMGGNVQIVFYRRDAQDDDVLLKVLLNEDEATLPVKTDMAPYYHWRDFRDYYLRKIEAFEQQWQEDGGGNALTADGKKNAKEKGPKG